MHDDYEMRFERLLGVGAIGRVYEAVSRAADQQLVAVKLVPNPSPEAFAEVHQQAKADHPHVVRVLAAYDNLLQLPGGDAPVRVLAVVTELMRGGELFDLVHREGGLAEGEVKRIMRQMCGALEHLHQRQLIHRDVKLENVLFKCRGQCLVVKLADFGFAIDADYVQQRPVLFTLGSADPQTLRALRNERASTRKELPEYGSKTDMYALGIMMVSFIKLNRF